MCTCAADECPTRVGARIVHVHNPCTDGRASDHAELSLPRACAHARLHALGHTREWDETMRQLRNVTKLVYVYASRRASAPLGRKRRLDVDIDDHGA
jgi:hypothetical protein